MKKAVVLFNLGGPDSLSAVRPFLKNLFSDKAIIGLPQPLRSLVANIISWRRNAYAKTIYSEIGGGSPLLPNTEEQARALERQLQEKGEYRVFIAMRYWHPFVSETVREVKAWQPDKVILLPLYPQFSTTTTQSAFDAWKAEAAAQKLHVAHHSVCCYPFDNHFIDAHIALIRPALEEAKKHGTPRLLFSAHGLPQKLVDKGDPYQWQVERTVSSLMRKLGDVDHVICYQSRVGPLAWLQPSTESELLRAGNDQVAAVIVPITFVSEHSETLYELDIQYRAFANKNRLKYYARVPALGAQPQFIQSLSWLCEATDFYPNCSNSLGAICPKQYVKCGYREW